jgi:probable F420-dependent oxidoreductase
MIKLGTSMPEHLIGTDAGAFTEFLKGVEQLGYGYVTIGDHILGADLSVRPDWKPYLGEAPLYDVDTPWHEPMVLFGYMAAITKRVEFSTGILVSPQRQAALLAKQAAQIEILTGGGRLRLVVAVGWNDVEYEGVGVNFGDRGKIIEEQFVVMRRLWTERSVTYHGQFHTLNAVGINPLPPAGAVPLWLGGQSKPALRRVGQFADGWFPFYPAFSPAQLEGDLAIIHDHARKAGRDPAAIGIEGAIYFHDPRFPMPADGYQPNTLDECVDYARWWKSFGASRFWVTAPWANLGPEETGVREVGKTWTGIEQRLRALEDFKIAIGPDF